MPRSAIVVLVVAWCALVVGCGADNEQPRTIMAGYAFGADVGDVGDVLAFRGLEDRGITVRSRDMGGTSEAIIGLTRGDVQLAQVTTAALQQAIAAGAPVKGVLGQNMVSEIVLVGGPGIETMDDLAGKTVSPSTPGGVGDTLITEALRAASMSRDDVNVVYIDESPTRAAAFAAGRIDAAALDYVDYELLRLRQPGSYTILDRAADRFPPVPALSWAVEAEWAEENAELLGDVVAGLVDGYEGVYTNEGREAWLAEARASFLGDEPDELAEAVYRFYRGLPLWPRASAAITEAHHAEATRWWLSTGQIEQPVTFEKSWLLDYWREAGEG